MITKTALLTAASGQEIPNIGLGTFGSDAVDAEQVSAAVKLAFETGYRHIDCAAVYLNEKEVGATLRQVFDGNAGFPAIAREDVWITSKLWNDQHGKAKAAPAFYQSLEDLGLDYLDLYLVHWPFPNFHPPKCDVNSRSPDARPYIHEEFMETWRELERLVDLGLVRHIGTSNMTIPKLKLLLRDARIKPFCNELELHPHFQQTELLTFLKTNEIIPIGYSPLGSPGRPERDRTPDDTVDMEDPVVVKIAAAHGVHPAAVCLKWAVQRGAVPIPFSANPKNIVANFRAITIDPLSESELERLAKVDKNCRLIKGQVFLWEGADDWPDLWDLDGTIAGWGNNEQKRELIK